MQPFKRIVFCDFDGTITSEETFVSMLKKFATQDYKSTRQKISDGRLSLRDGVRHLIESIPSRRYGEILENIRSKELRPGFAEFLDFLQGKNVPLVIISGGIGELIKLRLAAFMDRISAVYAPVISSAEPHLKIYSDFESDRELVSKTEVISAYKFEESVVIGDGLTDLQMALASEIVFARDGLARMLDEKGKPYQRWQNFFDIRDYLAERWGSV